MPTYLNHQQDRQQIQHSTNNLNEIEHAIVSNYYCHKTNSAMQRSHISSVFKCLHQENYHHPLIQDLRT